MSLFTAAEALQIEVGGRAFLEESRNNFQRIRGSKMPIENGLELVIVHHPTKSCAYTSIGYS